MKKSEQLKKQIAEFKEVLAGTTDSEERAAIERGISKLEKKLKEAEEAEKVPEKPKKEKKVAKKVVEKKEKVQKIHAETKKPLEEVSCEELKAAYEKRRAAAKLNKGKKTKPVLMKVAHNVEAAIKTAVAYNKKKGDLNVPKLRRAVKSFKGSLSELKEALAGDFEDTFIDKFSEDMEKVLKALETKKK